MAEFLQPFTPRPLGKAELSLAFFMAFLVLQPTIAASSTILGYETHVKYKFRDNGCEPQEYKTPFLQHVRRGIEKVFPLQADARRPFLLPRYIARTKFIRIDPRKDILTRFATIVGFIGMLRPHTFNILQLSSFILVNRQGEQRYSSFDNHLKHLCKDYTLLGFYIIFKSKTMSNARAYFPNLSSPPSLFADMCPVRALKQLAVRHYLRKPSLTKT